MEGRNRIYRNNRKVFWDVSPDLFNASSFVLFFVGLAMVITSIRTANQMNIGNNNITAEARQEQVKMEERLAELQRIRDALDEIVKKRLEISASLEEKLKPVLGDKITNVRGKIEIYTDVFFELGSAELTDDNMGDVTLLGEALCSLLTDMETDTGLLKIEFIEIRGHTDNIGDGISNRRLSIERAASFINAILPSGSEQEIKFGKYFKTAGLSKFAPAHGTVDEQTPSDQGRNRRIEVYIQFNEEDIYAEMKRLLST